ncbi:hypothetical protein [Pontibacter harenae]|uniref:hypothetical protein n=1 Tax=Pontibacter harenae TaxID=2894083 RepID=UPI001E63C40D|nr:hypothetical protein [Pontibacter harenae]
MKSITSESLTGPEVAKKMEAEIERAENLKISLLEGIDANPSSVVLMVNDIDSYVFELQELLVHLGQDQYSNEVLSSDRVQEFRNKILSLIASK